MFAKLSRTALFAAFAGAVLMASSAHAQADSVVDQAKAAGQVGEQTDGFLGFPPGANASADLRARVEQINIRRRAAYTERAQQRGVSASEMAAAVACQIFAQRIQVGERYRDQSGQWRARTAGQGVAMPSFCPG